MKIRFAKGGRNRRSVQKERDSRAARTVQAVSGGKILKKKSKELEKI